MRQEISTWLRCPGCDGVGSDISVFSYKMDIVLECHSCGETAEFTIGEDVPFNSLDAETIADEADLATD